MTLLTWLALVVAAILEVGGDALIRKGLRGSGWAMIAAGCLVLALYGLMVNTVKWDFSKLLGVYVAFFALVSVLCGLLSFQGDSAAFDLGGIGFHYHRRLGNPVRPHLGKMTPFLRTHDFCGSGQFAGAGRDLEAGLTPPQ